MALDTEIKEHVISTETEPTVDKIQIQDEQAVQMFIEQNDIPENTHQL